MLAAVEFMGAETAKTHARGVEVVEIALAIIEAEESADCFAACHVDDRFERFVLVRIGGMHALLKQKLKNLAAAFGGLQLVFHPAIQMKKFLSGVYMDDPQTISPEIILHKNVRILTNTMLEIFLTNQCQETVRRMLESFEANLIIQVDAGFNG